MSNPNDLKSMQNYWAEVEYYLSNITSEDMKSEHDIKNSIPILSLYFSPFILELLSDDNKNKLIEHLLKIREIFINKKNYTFSSQHCKEVENLVDELKNYFNEIGGNIPNLAILEKYENAIKAQQQGIQNRASELFGELTTHSISKPFKKIAIMNTIMIQIYTCIFFVVICFMYMTLKGDLGIVNVVLSYKENAVNFDNAVNFGNVFTKSYLIIPLIWLLLFLSKRINESKKIEQAYLHKYTIAQAYLNYLEFIKEKQYHLTNDESFTESISVLHKVAIDSLGLNPALLLEKSTAEKIPMEELLSKIIDKSIAPNKDKE